MGSFNLACAISGLSCTPGDEVYVLLLTRNNEYGGRDIYPNSCWVPRAPALRAKYDDYGSVRLSNAPEEQALQVLTSQLLDIESVETGPGRLDTPVRHGMGLESYLHAINEDLVAVACEYRRANTRWGEGMVDPTIGPIPTVASVVAVLERLGLKANDPHVTSFSVCEYEKGEVVVTCREYGDLKIDQAKSALDEDAQYVSVIARGRGHDQWNRALRVFPQPSSEGWVGPSDYLDTDKPKFLSTALVRADIWQALLAMRIPSWRSSHRDGLALAHYVADEKALRDRWFCYCNKANRDLDADLQRSLKRVDIDAFLWGRNGGKDDGPSTVAGHLSLMPCSGGSGSPGITGWSHHYERWLEAIATNDQAVDLVGKRFAECCMVYDHLSLRSMRIMPSQYAGQEEFWPQHAALHEEIRHIAARAHVKHDAEYNSKPSAEIRAAGFRLVRARQAKAV